MTETLHQELGRMQSELPGQRSVTDGIAAHIERPFSPDDPLQHPSTQTPEAHITEYKQKVSDFIAGHQDSLQLRTVAGPVHEKAHENAVSSALPEFKEDGSKVVSLLGEVLEIGGQAIAMVDTLESELLTAEKAQHALKALRTELLADGGSYETRTKFGNEFADNPDYAVSLAKAAKDSDANDWDKAAMLVIIDQATNTATHGGESSWLAGSTNAGQQSKIDAKVQQLELARQEIVGDRVSESRTWENPSGMLELLMSFKDVADQGVTLKQAQTYESITANYITDPKPVPKVASEITSLTDTYAAAPASVRFMMGTNEYDSHKLAEIVPILDSAEPTPLAEGEPAYLPSDRQKMIARMAGCSDHTEESSYSAAKFNGVINDLELAGVSQTDGIDLLRTRQNVERAEEALLAGQGDLLADFAALSLCGIPATEKNDPYANPQGHEHDVRDSIVMELTEHPEKYSEYVAMLKEKIPQLRETGFPVDLVTPGLLQRFNPSVAVNRHGNLDYEASMLDFCSQIGNSAKPLVDIDSQLAGKVIADAAWGHYSGYDRQVTPAEIAGLGDGLNRLKLSDEALYDWAQFGIDTNGMDPESIKRYMTTAEHLAAQPSIREQILKFTENNRTRYYEPAGAKFNNTIHYARTAEELDSFLHNTSTLMTRAENGFEPAALIGAAGRLKPDQLEGYLAQLDDPLILASMGQPELASQINQTIEPMTYYDGHADLARGITEYKELGHKEFFDFTTMVLAAAKFTQERGAENTDTLYSALKRASQQSDKNGYPYEGITELSGGLESLYADQSEQGKLHATENLAWYLQSSLPITAITAILSARSLARESGIADTPNEIYKWMFSDPEFITANSERTLKNYVARNYLNRNQDIAAARQLAEEKQNDFRILVNLEEDALLSVAAQDGGRLSSMFDRVAMAERRKGYETHRSGTEIALGLRSLDSATEHPIYGSCAFTDTGIPAGAQGYGNIVLTFPVSSQLEARTSFTPEDSFHGATRLSIEDAATLRVIKDSLGLARTTTTDYIESQVSGGLSLDEAEFIVVPDEEQAKSLRQSLPEVYAQKIKVRELSTLAW